MIDDSKKIQRYLEKQSNANEGAIGVAFKVFSDQNIDCSICMADGFKEERGYDIMGVSGDFVFKAVVHPDNTFGSNRLQIRTMNSRPQFNDCIFDCTADIWIQILRNPQRKLDDVYACSVGCLRQYVEDNPCIFNKTGSAIYDTRDVLSNMTLLTDLTEAGFKNILGTMKI